MTQPRPHTRDFSKKRAPVNFTIDGVRYDCFKALDLDQLARFAGLTSSFGEISRGFSGEVDGSDVEHLEEAANSTTVAVDKIADLMKIVMKKASYTIFISKLKPTPEAREADDFEPIDYHQLLDIVKWLMEVYTGRPTKSSSNSSSGSEIDDAGTDSTAGVSLEEPVELETSSRETF